MPAAHAEGAGGAAQMDKVESSEATKDQAVQSKVLAADNKRMAGLITQLNSTLAGNPHAVEVLDHGKSQLANNQQSNFKTFVVSQARLPRPGPGPPLRARAHRMEHAGTLQFSAWRAAAWAARSCMGCPFQARDAAAALPYRRMRSRR